MQTDLPPKLQEPTRSLLDNLMMSDPFVRYHQARARLDADAQARSLLNELSLAQARLRRKQGDGGVSQSEIDSLRALQQEVQRNPAIISHARAQQEAVNLLREINTEISQLLGIDFASFANRSTC